MDIKRAMKIVSDDGGKVISGHEDRVHRETTPMWSKIRYLRECLSLSRVEFALITGVSVNTLKSIETKGSDPKSIVLVKICAIWPEFAYWFLTGSEGIMKNKKPVPVNSLYEAERYLDSLNFRVTYPKMDAEKIDGLFIRQEANTVNIHKIKMKNRREKLKRRRNQRLDANKITSNTE